MTEQEKALFTILILIVIILGLLIPLPKTDE